MNTPATNSSSDTGPAVVLSGGGARAAYQAGVLRGLARHVPELRFPIITGVSAGAINAVHLAAHPGSPEEATEDLVRLWSNLSVEQVFRVDGIDLGRNLMRWATRLVSGGAAMAPKVRGMVDTQPLEQFLRRALKISRGEHVVPGIAENLETGFLNALAVTTLNYGTGQTVTWVQGREIEPWDRPNRRAEKTEITVDHIMASASLPLLFPAIRLTDGWYGDGGIRLAAPLSPALHLGARRLLTISTRYDRNVEEARVSSIGDHYPPPAQVLGNLLNAIFLDVTDQDAERLLRMNDLLTQLPEEQRRGQRPIELMVFRPSQDLGRLSSQYEVQLPKAFRFLTRSLGTRETRSPDFLSLLMFQSDYLRRLIEIGEADAEARKDEVIELSK